MEERKTSLSLVEFPSKSTGSPHQLLELVLLHLDLAAALGADGMDSLVVTTALDVGHAGSRARCVDGDAVLGVTDKGTSGGFVGLATIGVASFPDCQHSGVG